MFFFFFLLLTALSSPLLLLLLLIIVIIMQDCIIVMSVDDDSTLEESACTVPGNDGPVSSYHRRPSFLPPFRTAPRRCGLLFLLLHFSIGKKEGDIK